MIRKQKIKRGKYYAIRVDGKYVMEHRLVMEKHIGRKLLPTEIVHHKNHNPEDNSIDNLELFDSAGQHTKIAHQDLFEKQKIDFKGKHFSPASEFKKGDPRLLGNTWGFKKGFSTWNKGKPHSEKHIANLKKAWELRKAKKLLDIKLTSRSDL